MSLCGSICRLSLCSNSRLPEARPPPFYNRRQSASVHHLQAPVTDLRLSSVSLFQRLRNGTLLTPPTHKFKESGRPARTTLVLAYRWNDDEIAEEALGVSFEESVRLFNAREYYRCHDVLESLWNNAGDPQRSIFHGILQCAVGLHHLLHRNHKGAMVELGEGITKLRRVGFVFGALHDFEQEASAVLEFIYNTQLEYAACSDDMCINMDGSEQSYRLLGNFGSGQSLYRIVEDSDRCHIEFLSQQTSAIQMGFELPAPPKVKVPLLQVSEEDLYNLL